MQLSHLLVALQDRGLPTIYTSLGSGHTYVQLLTTPTESLQSLPRTLANSFNLIEDGAPIQHAIEQVDMWIEPSYLKLLSLDDLAKGCSIVFCNLSHTYVIIQHGMFSLYIDAAGTTYSCWSQSNDRNSYQ